MVDVKVSITVERRVSTAVEERVVLSFVSVVILVLVLVNVRELPVLELDGVNVSVEVSGKPLDDSIELDPELENVLEVMVMLLLGEKNEDEVGNEVKVELDVAEDSAELDVLTKVEDKDGVDDEDEMDENVRVEDEEEREDGFVTDVEVDEALLDISDDEVVCAEVDNIEVDVEELGTPNVGDTCDELDTEPEVRELLVCPVVVEASDEVSAVVVDAGGLFCVSVGEELPEIVCEGELDDASDVQGPGVNELESPNWRGNSKRGVAVSASREAVDDVSVTIEGST
ncbi:hypothetical protein EW145_g3661 [Phellinidium pouzarii]|uniref:Uncharacterized protein n=1 Tax=Phellinidium pouzarii TaxID=167371 RepID=A0A4V3XCS5_9AGAM|nr:hypothetical protein EW145_g3661 [Phellinidium pouzarii]